MNFQPAHARNAAVRLLLIAAAFCLYPATLCQTTLPAQVSAQDTADSRIESLLQNLSRVRAPVTATISPDGKTVAWAVVGPRGSELHVTAIAPAGSTPDRIISPDTIGDVANGRPGECPSSDPVWSPDGKQLAFLSECSGSGNEWGPEKQNNIFVWIPATNDMKQVSHLHGAVNSLQWSPNGEAIAFLYVENATRQAGALDAMKPWNGVYGEDGVEVQRVYAVQVDDGKGAWLTPEKLHVYEFSWSPANPEIAFVAANPPGENNWWVAKLYVERVRMSAQQPTNPEAPAGFERIAQLRFDPATTPSPLHGLQIAVPRFSPDGKQIAFIGGLMSDQGSTGGDICVIPTTGLKPGEVPTDVTPDIDGTPAWLNWESDHTVGFVEDCRGHTRLNAVNTHDLKITPGAPVDLGEVSISGGPIKDAIGVAIPPADHKHPTLALVESGFAAAPEVFAGPVGHLQQITHLNDALKPAWGKAESIDYTNDGFPIQGWLLYPAGWTPNDAANGKKYPLIVSVHGGPSAAVTPRWPTASYGAVPFSALGYFVFLPNPRGSFGQGEKFTQANVRDFGYGDLRDILAGVDLLEKRFPIDQQREGLTGWSYGGFMTMFGVTQTTRFRAAVAGAGVSNWQSYYGENSIDQWMVPFFGATVYDDPTIYAKSSAIDFIKQVKTPTLIVVGDRDGECPAPQSFEFWHALKAEGVKTQLVIYPNEGHHLSNPQHQRDVLVRALNWFQAEMPPN